MKIVVFFSKSRTKILPKLTKMPSLGPPGTLPGPRRFDFNDFCDFDEIRRRKGAAKGAQGSAQGSLNRSKIV